jgi:hypothetical protein
VKQSSGFRPICARAPAPTQAFSTAIAAWSFIDLMISNSREHARLVVV